MESWAARASRPLLLVGGALFSYALYELVHTGVATGALFAGSVVIALGLIYLRW